MTCSVESPLRSVTPRLEERLSSSPEPEATLPAGSSVVHQLAVGVVLIQEEVSSAEKVDLPKPVTVISPCDTTIDSTSSEAEKSKSKTTVIDKLAEVIVPRIKKKKLKKPAEVTAEDRTTQSTQTEDKAQPQPVHEKEQAQPSEISAAQKSAEATFSERDNLLEKFTAWQTAYNKCPEYDGPKSFLAHFWATSQVAEGLTEFTSSIRSVTTKDALLQVLLTYQEKMTKNSEKKDCLSQERIKKFEEAMKIIEEAIQQLLPH